MKSKKEKWVVETAALLVALYHEHKDNEGVIIERAVLEQATGKVIDLELMGEINKKMPDPLIVAMNKRQGIFVVMDKNQGLRIESSAVDEMMESGMSPDEVAKVISIHAHKKEKGELD